MTKLHHASRLFAILSCAVALLPGPRATAADGRVDRAEADPVAAVRFDPVVKQIEGWTVHIEPSLIDGEHAAEGERALTMLASHLQRVAILVPAETLAQLRKVEIWIEHDHPRLKGKQYHGSLAWVTGHGYDPRLAKKVHIPRAAALISRADLLKQPAVVLHELAHGFHDQVLGFDDERIVNAYQKAMEAGIYEQVLSYRGDMVRHYGATNHKEYFAEMTEAYFYRNDFYPFVRGELKRHDPAMYELLGEIWGEE